MVQWMDVNQLSQEENLHSRCVCISQLPLDLCDSEELTQLFSETYKPVFCQVGAPENCSLCLTGGWMAEAPQEPFNAHKSLSDSSR